MLTLDDGHSETNLTLMGVASGPILQPTVLTSKMETAADTVSPPSGGEDDDSSQPVLTQLCNSDFKFGHIDFRSVFVPQVNKARVENLREETLHCFFTLAPKVA